MNLFERAYASVTRRTSKSVILLLIFVMLFTILGAGIAIGESVRNVDKTMKEIMGARVSMKIDQHLNDPTLTGISYETIKKFGENPLVKYYDYNVISDSVSTIHNKTVNTTLYGYSYAPMIDMITKKIKLVEGEMLSEQQLQDGDAGVLISKDFADVYKISIGDMFDVSTFFSYNSQISMIINEIYQYHRDYNSPNFSWNTVDTGNEKVDEFVLNYYEKYADDFSKKETVKMRVQGIFELRQGTTTVDKDEDGYYSTRIYVANKYLTNTYESILNDALTKHHDVFESIPLLSDRMATVTQSALSKTLDYEPTFILSTIDDVKEFISKTRITLPGNVSFVESNDGIYAVNKQMESVNTIANTITYISLIATIAIVPLCLVLFLRERRKEFGIYASIGLRKYKIVGQIITETMAIAVVAMSISFFSGTLIARNLSNQMIDLQFSVASVDASGAEMVSFLTNDEITDNYRVKVSPAYIVTMSTLGLGTVLVASIVPVVYVLRLKPKKILL